MMIALIQHSNLCPELYYFCISSFTIVHTLWFPLMA